MTTCQACKILNVGVGGRILILYLTAACCYRFQVNAFAYAAQTVLRPAMMSFYAAASDFTRRLTSVRANGKFSSIDAGPDSGKLALGFPIYTLPKSAVKLKCRVIEVKSQTCR